MIHPAEEDDPAVPIEEVSTRGTEQGGRGPGRERARRPPSARTAKMQATTATPVAREAAWRAGRSIPEVGVHPIHRSPSPPRPVPAASPAGRGHVGLRYILKRTARGGQIR